MPRKQPYFTVTPLSRAVLDAYMEQTGVSFSFAVNQLITLAGIALRTRGDLDFTFPNEAGLRAQWEQMKASMTYDEFLSRVSSPQRGNFEQSRKPERAQTPYPAGVSVYALDTLTDTDLPLSIPARPDAGKNWTPHTRWLAYANAHPDGLRDRVLVARVPSVDVLFDVSDARDLQKVERTYPRARYRVYSIESARVRGN